MKTSELAGAALDWAVAKAEEFDADALVQLAKRVPGKDYGFFLTKYSTNWAQGGPILEREKITIFIRDEEWFAHSQLSTPEDFHGDTPLIAAMRCYVASKLGDEVEIPKELA
jgi:hypothetical protein